MLTREVLQQNQNRWDDVAKIKSFEATQLSYEQKLKKFYSIYQMAADLGLLTNTKSIAPDKIAVWDRWNHLRNLHLTKQQN